MSASTSRLPRRIVESGKYSQTQLDLAERLLGRLLQGRDVRVDKVARARKRVASHRFNEDAKIDFILDRVLEDLE